VNINGGEADGEYLFRSVVDVPVPIEGAIIVVPAKAAIAVLDDCKRANVKSVWVQQGAESDDVLAKSYALGLPTIHHSCAFMHMPGVGFPHSLHRWFADSFIASRDLPRLREKIGDRSGVQASANLMDGGVATMRRSPG
jgi:hypothetical protein